MSSADNTVIHLHERDVEGALERLNRITGLSFARWPQSLVQVQVQVQVQQGTRACADDPAEAAPRNAETG